jgi:hypothetical protein
LFYSLSGQLQVQLCQNVLEVDRLVISTHLGHERIGSTGGVGIRRPLRNVCTFGSCTFASKYRIVLDFHRNCHNSSIKLSVASLCLVDCRSSSSRHWGQAFVPWI